MQGYLFKEYGEHTQHNGMQMLGLNREERIIMPQKLNGSVNAKKTFAPKLSTNETPKKTKHQKKQNQHKKYP